MYTSTSTLFYLACMHAWKEGRKYTVQAQIEVGHGPFGHVIKSIALVRTLDSSLDVDSLQISSSLPLFGIPR